MGSPKNQCPNADHTAPIASKDGAHTLKGKESQEPEEKEVDEDGDGNCVGMQVEGVEALEEEISGTEED